MTQVQKTKNRAQKSTNFGVQEWQYLAFIQFTLCKQQSMDGRTQI